MDTYYITCTTYIETMNLQALYAEFNDFYLKESIFCFSLSYICISYKLQIVGTVTPTPPRPFEIFIIPLGRKLYQFCCRPWAIHSKTKEKRTKLEML